MRTLDPVSVPRVRLPPAERRRQIVQAATEVIGRRGYYGFSVAAVAERCGLTVAGLLHHVGTKDGLLIAVLEDRDRRDSEAVTGRAGLWLPEAVGVLALPEAVQLLHDLVQRNRSQPEIVRLYSMLRTESLYEGHPAHEFFARRDEQVLGLFARLVSGHVAAPASTARQLLALMGGLEEQWLRDPDGVDLVAEWDRAVAAVLPAPLTPRG